MPTGLHQQATDLREFNRFYTGRIGVLKEGLLDSPYSLAQVRVMYELNARGSAIAADLARVLGLDRGYLSRLLSGLRTKGLLASVASPDDGRSQVIALTAKGRTAFAPLDRRSQEEAVALIAPLDEQRRRSLLASLRSVRQALGDAQVRPKAIALRAHRPGDIGRVTQRHGEIYWREYRWDERFEALVASIMSTFIEQFKPGRERCWIAERDGEFLGCVFLVEKDATTAQLRCLLVEPAARGCGLGRRLVEACVRFARAKGYASIVLWTNSVLQAARHIYEQAGFRLVSEEAHHSYGQALVGQYWELAL